MDLALRLLDLVGISRSSLVDDDIATFLKIFQQKMEKKIFGNKFFETIGTVQPNSAD